MVIGNDLVDLDCPDNQRVDRVERYAVRCCTSAEQQWIAGEEYQLRAFWWLWTLKEAGYKAIRQLGYPSFNVANRIECIIHEPYRSAQVKYAGEVFWGWSLVNANYIHSIVSSERADAHCFQVIHPHESFAFPGDGKWNLIKSVRGIPQLRHSDTSRAVPCSKSHDGEWQALAWCVAPVFY